LRGISDAVVAVQESTGTIDRHPAYESCNGMDRISDWLYIMSMKTLAAAKFKEQCLSILDHLEPDGLVITKHGKPVARILPAGRASADLIGAFRGRIRVKGDIQSTGVTWEAHG
jgi:hypothetical protein